MADVEYWIWEEGSRMRDVEGKRTEGYILLIPKGKGIKTG